MKKSDKAKIEQPYQVAERLLKAWDIKTWVKDEEVLSDILSAIEEAFIEGQNGNLTLSKNVNKMRVRKLNKVPVVTDFKTAEFKSLGYDHDDSDTMDGR